ITLAALALVAALEPRAGAQPPLPAAAPEATAARSGLELPAPAIEREGPGHHPVRAVLEAAAAFGINVAWYWWDVDFNTPDWDLHWDWASWKKKAVTFDAVRFDANHFSTN